MVPVVDPFVVAEEKYLTRKFLPSLQHKLLLSIFLLSLQQQLSTVSYFYLQRVRNITSDHALEKILNEATKKGDREVLLKN